MFSTTIRRNTDDEGFGLIEIVISMFILSVLALGFLPLLISSLILAADNASLATATQMVNTQMDISRQTTDPTCAAMVAFVNETVPTVSDRQGNTLTVKRSVTCPVEYPGVARFKALVESSASARPLAEATTLIYVVRAS